MSLEKFLGKIVNWATTDGIKLIIGIFLLWIGWKLAKKIVNILNKALERRNIFRSNLKRSSSLSSFRICRN